jgi:hypothetical protein
MRTENPGPEMPEVEYETKILKCADCSQEFPWSIKDQIFYAQQRFSPPRRCRACRERRKRERT